jgi:hypothetical protein
MNKERVYPQVVLHENVQINDRVVVFYQGQKMEGRYAGRCAGGRVDVNIDTPVKGCAECEVAQ